MHGSVIWTGLFWAWTASEIALAISTHTRRSEGAVHDRGSLFVLWAVIAGSITASNWALHLLPSADFVAPWVPVIAVALLAAGLVIRWSAILSLGRFFSVNVAIQTSQIVYRKGLYRLVRHPSYLGIMVIFLGIGLHLGNWAAVGIMLLLPAAALLYRIHVEEKALTTAFGIEYQAYCAVTKRLIPGVF